MINVSLLYYYDMNCWQKEENWHLASINNFDDDNLWSVEDLMMIYGEMLET